MRIALVTCSFLPRVGGAEFVIHNLARHWTAQGHEVVVMNAASDRPPEGASYACRRFRVLRGSDRFGYHRFPFFGFVRRQLKRMLAEWRPDFVSAHFGYPTAFWLADLRQRFIMTCHGGDITPFEWGYRRVHGIDGQLAAALNGAHRVVAISTYARTLLLDLGVAGERIVHIPNGVDIERFRSRPPFDLRDRFGLPPDARVVVSVGRDHPAKDYGTGLRAFQAVAGRLPDARYVLIGRGSSRWQPLVDELGLGSRVVLCPGLQGGDLVGAYQQADVFFSCSVQEMFPLVVVEAMAAGRPAVVTDVSGSQDMIRTGENGLVVTPGRAGEMADALVRLLEDPQERDRMGRLNLERSLEYSWERVAGRYLEQA
jgi:glycosyltransferase involved in cell wall biosynthesis